MEYHQNNTDKFNNNYNDNIVKWTENIEKILIEQRNKCAAYRWMHELQSDILSKRNKFLNIFNILIISFSATSSIVSNNSSLKTDESQWPHILNIIYPVLLYITTVVSAIQHFLNYEKEAEKHRTASIRYTALFNNIKRMLILSDIQRQDVNNYFTWVNKEYDTILASSPDIFSHIISKFQNKFNTDLSANITNIDIQIDQKDENIVEHLETDRLKYELDRFMVNSYTC